MQAFAFGLIFPRKSWAILFRCIGRRPFWPEWGSSTDGQSVPEAGSRFYVVPFRFASRSSLLSVAGFGPASNIPTLNFAKSAKFRMGHQPENPRPVAKSATRTGHPLLIPGCRQHCEARGIQHRSCVAVQAAPRLSTQNVANLGHRAKLGMTVLIMKHARVS